MAKTPKEIYLKVKDHSVSGEEFDLLYDEELEMLITHPQPTIKNLSAYYETDDYISHTDAKRNLFEKVYHLVRSITLKRKLNLIAKYNSSDSKNLLDVGCGTGDFLLKAQNAGWKIHGVEPDNGAREMAIKKAGESIFQNMEIIESLQTKFDIITLWHVLEHLPNLEHQIKFLKSLLHPNGVLIIAVPNFKSYDAQFYKRFWAAYDVPRHLWHFSKTSLNKLAGRINMSVEKILPMKFDAYYVSLLSEKNKIGFLGLRGISRAFRVGWLSNFKASRSKEYSSLIYIIKNREELK